MTPLLALLLCSGLLGMASAQGTEEPKGGRLSVIGVGTVSVVPDVAKVYLAVSVTKPTARDACGQAATTTASVRTALDAIDGIDAEDVTTENYNVSPNYVYEQTTSTQRISGYTCSQSMVVKIDGSGGSTTDLSATLAAVIDSAVRTGGNDLQVSQVAMELSPALKRSATNEARTAAVDDATETAALLASAAKVTLGAIRSISDSNVAPPPPMPMTSGAGMAAPEASAADATTPVQIGATTVDASVAIEYAIS